MGRENNPRKLERNLRITFLSIGQIIFLHLLRNSSLPSEKVMNRVLFLPPNGVVALTEDLILCAELLEPVDIGSI